MLSSSFFKCSKCSIIIQRFAILLFMINVQSALGQSGSSSGYPPVIRHPGTCTFQRSQAACTFSLLCYLAGGVPLEGCSGDISTTCCMLYNNYNSPFSLNLQQSLSPSSPSPTSHYHHHEHEHPSQSSLTSHSQLHYKPQSLHSISSPPQNYNHHREDSYPNHYTLHHTSSNELNSNPFNTIRRTRPANNVKPPFKEISSRQMHSRSFVGEDFCGKPSAKPLSRIIGGQDAYFGEFPWQVHIKIAKHQCGGALINQQYIVTAAHCIYKAPVPQLNVIIGAHDIEDHRYQDIPPQYFGVADIKIHPNFRFSASHPDRYDIAVLRLDRPVRYNDNVLPICLPQDGFRYEGWYGVVTGWGKTDPALSNRYGTRLLQKVDVPIIDNEECETWHRTRGIDLRIFPEMMCAGYEDGRKDACVGDSGGPLVVNVNGRWTLAGITSAGFGCAQSRQPGIYHRVSHTVDWILSNIQP